MSEFDSRLDTWIDKNEDFKNGFHLVRALYNMLNDVIDKFPPHLGPSKK